MYIATSAAASMNWCNIHKPVYRVYACCWCSSSSCCVDACVRGCLRDRHRVSAGFFTRRGLFWLIWLSCYLLPFGTPGRHTQAWASPPPQPVASLPHHHHCWLSASRWSAGRYLERSSSVPRAFLERFFERFGCFWACEQWFFCYIWAYKPKLALYA